MSDLSWRDGIYRAGAVQAGYIEEVEGLHPELYFKYRVKSPAECEKLIAGAIVKDAKTQPGDLLIQMQKEVKDSVTHWSLNAELGTELSHALVKRVFWIIVQSDPSNPIPARFENPGSLEEQVKKS